MIRPQLGFALSIRNHGRLRPPSATIWTFVALGIIHGHGPAKSKAEAFGPGGPSNHGAQQIRNVYHSRDFRCKGKTRNVGHRSWVDDVVREQLEERPPPFLASVRSQNGRLSRKAESGT